LRIDFKEKRITIEETPFLIGQKIRDEAGILQKEGFFSCFPVWGKFKKFKKVLAFPVNICYP